MPDQQKSAEWNRGGYLVEGPAIAAPATRRRTSSAPTNAARPLAAAWSQGRFAPRLDGAARSGLKSWSVEDIAEYLQSGRNGRSHAGGLMSEVVVNSTSKMSDARCPRHRRLSEGVCRPARRSLWSAPPPPAQMADGEKLYQGACIACHEADGSGAPRIYPPLPGNANLQSADPSSHAAHHPRRRRDRDDAARAQHRIDAGLCRENVGPADRRCHELHPQCLGQCRAGGDARTQVAKARRVEIARVVSADRR